MTIMLSSVPEDNYAVIMLTVQHWTLPLTSAAVSLPHKVHVCLHAGDKLFVCVSAYTWQLLFMDARSA